MEARARFLPVMSMSSSRVSERSNVKGAEMNVSRERAVAASSGFETAITRSEIEIWAKVEQAISGKNALIQKILAIYDWPREHAQAVPAALIDNLGCP